MHLSARLCVVCKKGSAYMWMVFDGDGSSTKSAADQTRQIFSMIEGTASACHACHALTVSIHTHTRPTHLHPHTLTPPLPHTLTHSHPHAPSHPHTLPPAGLTQHDHSWDEVSLVYLYLAEMADFPAVNAVYSSFFSSIPPARYGPYEAFVHVNIYIQSHTSA